ncbi:hypothetical protein [uncultured Adlercreutzia sp.]|uniref:hypothetical protein n=1 Tax=uncultured Adlercreutzia sp. TaxID=875803 RepID=UPI0026F3AC12|nr:hypothetical protein [uncultured Adlercreutzia sp.]
MNDSHYVGGISEAYTGATNGSNPYHTWRNKGSILVNRFGNRFCQEDAEWGYVTAEAAREAYRTGWQADDPDGVNVCHIVDSDNLHTWQYQVIAVGGEPIPRLYAAGAVAGGNYRGAFYPGCGWAILTTVVWGREAGKNAAALDSWEA